jgi:hypothetical protein
MILLKIIGLFLCFGFVALLHGLGTAATELPVGEGWEEEETSDDEYYFQIANGRVTEGSLAKE